MINSVLHETIIRDIIDMSKDIGDNVEDVKKAMSSAYSKNSFTSIAKASSDLVLVFPFMCDSTVSMESASMVSRAIERQCVSMLRLLFSALQLSKDKSPDAISFLSQFHKNISSADMGDVTVDDFLAYADKLSESKDVTVIFLSARAKSTKKDSNSMFFFEDAAKKSGVNMITVDPSSSSISGTDGKHKIIDHSNGKNEYIVSPQNCVVFTRRTCLKNSESKDFVREMERLGYVMINSLDTMEICEDKFVTYKKLKAANISTPQTVVISSSSMNKLEEKVQSIGGRFPIVAKILEGTQGSGVMIFESISPASSI